MGLLDMLRGRTQNQLENIALLRLDRRNGDKSTNTEAAPSPGLKQGIFHEAPFESDTNKVTSGAQPGIQKAEAVALVWTKQVVYLTYAW